MKTPSVLLLIVLVFLSAISHAQNLKLNLQKGETYFQNSNATISIKQDLGGQTMDIGMEVNGKMSFAVMDKTDEYYILETKYTSLAMSTKSPYGNMDFSSEKGTGTDDVMSSILAEMLTHSFEVKMSPDGSIIEIKNLEEMFASIFDSFEDIPEMQRMQLSEQLQQSYGEDSFKGNIELVTAIFPDKDVKVNDTWSNSVKLRSGMNMVLNNEYTLTELNDEYALIDVTSTSKTEEQDDFQNINGMPAKYNLNGTMKATIKVDSKTGWILLSDMHQEIKGAIEIADNPQVPGGMSIPMEMVSDTKITNE